MKASVWVLWNSKCWGRHVSGIYQICIFCEIIIIFFFCEVTFTGKGRILLISLITHTSASFQMLLLKDGQISPGPSYINHFVLLRTVCAPWQQPFRQYHLDCHHKFLSCFLPGTSGPSTTSGGYMNTVKVSGWDMPGFTKTELLSTSRRYNNPFTLPRKVLHLQGNCVSVVRASRSEKHPPLPCCKGIIL